MKKTISMIPYANMAPYEALEKPTGLDWVAMTPRESVAALSEGRVAAAAVPVAALPALGDTVEYVGCYGIAALDSVGSVLLFSKVPFDELGKESTIDLTNHSVTAIRLLYLLLGYQHGFENIAKMNLIEPNIEQKENRKDAHAKLLIGDNAMIHAQKDHRSYVIDLVSEWFKTHKKPFVFARWVVRRDAPLEVKQKLEDWLAPLRQKDDELIIESAPAEAQRIGTTTHHMIKYLRAMKRVLGPEEVEGQELFLREWTLKMKLNQEGADGL